MASNDLETPLYAESPAFIHTKPLTNPRAWFRHPLLRMFIAFMVLFMDFFTYGEDPIADSHVDYNSMGTGQMAGLLSFWYAPTLQYKLEKVGFLIVALVIGHFIGKGLRMLLVKLNCTAFKSDGGIISCFAIGAVIAIFIVDEIYNRTLGTEPARWQIDTSSMQLFQAIFRLEGKRNVDMGKMWQWISASADWLAIIQLLDCIFQDKKYWPEFLPRTKAFYTDASDGKFRKLCFWIGLPLLIFLTGLALNNTGDEPGQFNWQIDWMGGRSEIGRAVAAGIIVFQDLFFLVQDWEFPLFSEKHHDPKDRTSLAGTDSSSLKIPCFKLSVSAKWLQYGPMFLVGIFDMLYLKGMFMYTPQLYGEYTDPSDNRIWVITDNAFLAEVYPSGVNVDPSLLEKVSWAARRDAAGECLASVPSCLTDIHTLSKYKDSSLDYIGLGVGLAAIIAFIAAVSVATKQAQAELHPGVRAIDEGFAESQVKVEPQ